MCFGNYNKFHRKVFESIGMDSRYWEDPEYNSLEALARNGKNVEVIAEMERIFRQRTWAEWEPLLVERELACERCRTVADVLEDPEAFANDQLRRVQYDDQGYGSDNCLHCDHCSRASGEPWGSGALPVSSRGL